jgi:hypothetical protein
VLRRETLLYPSRLWIRNGSHLHVSPADDPRNRRLDAPSNSNYGAALNARGGEPHPQREWSMRDNSGRKI